MENYKKNLNEIITKQISLHLDVSNVLNDETGRMYVPENISKLHWKRNNKRKIERRKKEEEKKPSQRRKILPKLSLSLGKLLYPEHFESGKKHTHTHTNLSYVQRTGGGTCV